MSLFKCKLNKYAVQIKLSTEDGWYITDQDNWRHHLLFNISRAECLNENSSAFNTFKTYSISILKLAIIIVIKKDN